VKDTSAKRRHLRTAVVLALWSPLYLLAKLVPKDKRLCIFGSSLGQHFADNSKYLYLYMSRHLDNVRSVFVSHRRDVVRFLRDNGLTAEYLWSPRGIWTVLRAHRAFVSHSTEDIHPALLGGAEVIQLWHGTPLRKISYDSKWVDASGLKSRLRRYLLKIVYALSPYAYGSVTFNTIVISSETVRPSYRSAFRIRDDRMLLSGQPRNDCLDPEYPLDEKLFPELPYLQRLSTKAELIVSWLPTQRANARFSMVNLLFDYGFDPGAHGRFLAEHGMHLVIKPHFRVAREFGERLSDCANVTVYDYADPYPLLRVTDVLVTDYSSVYFDYLLLDRPIIFAPFDCRDYVKLSASFYYPYNDVTPGPKCRDWPEVMRELGDVAARRAQGEADPFRQGRIAVRDMFNRHRRDFSRRIVEQLFGESPSGE